MARNGSAVGRGVKVPSSRDLLDAAVARAAAADGASVEALRAAIMARVRELRRKDDDTFVARATTRAGRTARRAATSPRRGAA